MLGAGGAAHAIGYALNTFGPKEFRIYNIDLPMIGRLVKQLKLKKVITGDIAKDAEKDAAMASADFVINCTSVGMHSNDAPYKIDKLKKGAVVFRPDIQSCKDAFFKKCGEKRG